jgi:hypothetical protein
MPQATQRSLRFIAAATYLAPNSMAIIRLSSLSSTSPDGPMNSKDTLFAPKVSLELCIGARCGHKAATRICRLRGPEEGKRLSITVRLLKAAVRRRL